MIIVQDHDQPQQSSIQNSRKRKVVFDADQQTRQMFKNLLSVSQNRIDNDARTRLQTMRKNRENRVYANLDYSANDYLLILLKERNEKIEKDADLVQEILNKRQKGVIQDLKFNNLSINRSKRPISVIKQELQENLQVMRLKNPEKHLSPQYHEKEKEKRKQQLRYENYLQFRRHSYWKVPNQRHQSALKMISSIKSQQNEQRQRNERASNIRNDKKKFEQKQQILQKQLKKKHQRQKLHQNYNQQRLIRQRQLKQQSQKQKKVEQYLAKYKNKAPTFIIFQQNQKKMKEMQEIRMKSVLSEVKEKKRRYRLSQINQSIEEYQQKQQIRAEQFQEKRLFDLQSEKQIKQRLNLLYKSKIGQLSAALQVKPPDQKQVRHQKIMKMMMYSERVKQQHAPQVDEQKKQSLIQIINDFRKKQNMIQKIKDGQLILIDKSQLNPREIGLQYLEQVKQITSQIERKPPQPPAPVEFKIVDKSLAKKMPKSKRTTITNWKAIIDDQHLTEQQKGQKLKIYFQLIEQQRIRVSQQKKTLSLSKSIDLQRKMDHYQLQKAAAKLSLLKSMI